MKDLTDPTNVDSVPAMLTEGEFVLNKEATAMFGPIIEKMNNAGLQQRAAENQAALNAGGYAQYNVGGLVSFLKREEGFKDKAYQDSGGKWTIGYGRTFNADGTPVKAGQTTTRKAEDSWLSERAQSDYDATKKHLDANGIEYTENQLQALASFRYNGGHGMLSSLTDNGARNIDEIYSMLPAYNKVTKNGKKVEVQGLTNRRAAEMALWGGEGLPVKPKPRPSQGDSSVPPTADAIADAAPAPGIIDDLISTAISEYSMPSVQMHVPQMMGGQTMPDYIPSVTEKTMKQRQQVGHFNEGGFVDWLFNRGGRKKDNDTTADYPAIPPIATYDPMVGGFDTMAPALNNQVNIQHLPPIPGVSPSMPVDTSAPDVTITNRERWQQIKEQRDKLPKGSEERNALNRKMNAITVNDKPFVPDVRNKPAPTPQAPAVPEPAPAIPKPESVQTAMPDMKVPDDMGPVTPAQDAAAEEQAALREEQEYKLQEALRQKQMQLAVAAPDAPGRELLENQIKVMTEQLDQLGVPPESQGVGVDVINVPDIAPPNIPQADPLPPEIADATTVVPSLDAVSPDQPKKKSLGETDPVAAEEAINTGLAKHGEDVPEELAASDVKEVAAKGKQAIATNPGLAKNASSALKSAFGDLFDSNELKRMAIVFAGAMLTGATPGQALQYAGGMYLQRVDAKANQFTQLAASGKYTTASLKAYRESGDPTALVAVGATPEMTGNYKTMYTDKGQKVIVQEVKVGDNTILVDEAGNQVNGFKLQGKSPEQRATYIKEHQGAVESQLEEMRKTFDVQDDFSKTDILPTTNSQKIMEWALDNDVDPAELGGLVESAYHDAMNDRRQDGSRARNLVPYLNQLVIRQSIPGGSEVFKLTEQPKDGHPAYVNAAKLQKLNLAASNKLKGMGHKGSTQDLANMFYTEALKDWNAMTPAVRADWNRKAGKDVNGFYLYAEHMLLKQ